MRMEPIIALETTSGIRASSMLKARMAIYAGLICAGTKADRVYEGESYFLLAVRYASLNDIDRYPPDEVGTVRECVVHILGPLFQ